MRYSIGCNLGTGVNEVEIGVENVKDIKESTIFLLLGSSSSGELSKYYTSVREILKPKKQNKLILLIEGSASDIRKAICNLCVQMECYNIYSIEDVEEVSAEFMDIVESREPTLNEVHTFISPSLSGYDKMAEIVAQFTACVDTMDMETLKDLVNQEMESILTFPELIDYMKTVIGENSVLGDNNDKQMVEELDKRTKELTLKLAEQTKIATDSGSLIEGLEGEILRLTERYKEATQAQGSSKTGISQYRAINLTKLRGATVQKVLYFKEITPVPYINSMLYFLQKGLAGGLVGIPEEKKCKIVVYDRANEFVAIYQDMQFVDGEKMTANPNILKTAKNILVTEPSQHIMESLLKTDNEILIVYDKMRMSADLVDGYTVTKFHIINSKKEVECLERAKGTQFKHRNLVTGFGAYPDTLQVKTFEEFGRSGETAKQSYYMKTSLPGSNERLYSAILKESGLLEE